MFSLSSLSADGRLTFLGGFSFFSGLPSFSVRLLSALRVRFLADADAEPEPEPSVGDDTFGAVDAVGASMTVDMKSRAGAALLSFMYIMVISISVRGRTLGWGRAFLASFDHCGRARGVNEVAFSIFCEA